MFRSHTYNEGQFYTLVPVHRQSVVPGQSLELDVSASWETSAFTRNILSGGSAALMAFYVPYRLLWDEWVDFISDPQSTAVVPTSTVLFPAMFEKSATAQNTFGRRAYKLIYNQFFGSDQFDASAPTWYADITADSVTAINRTRTIDQMLGRLMLQSAAPDEGYVAPVTGTSPNQIATISLNEFRQAMKNARSDRRSDLTGDKYVDAMRRMGVALDWRIQQAPEFLGSASVDFNAKETRATFTPSEPPAAGAAATGRAYARFNEMMHLRTPRRFFAEHGIVVTVLVVRPVVFSALFKAPYDAFVSSREGFFLGDNQTGVNIVPAASYGLTGENATASRFLWLRAGQNMVGNTSLQPWWVDSGGTDFANVIYPTVTIPQDDTLSGEFAVYSRINAGGPTPVKGTVV